MEKKVGYKKEYHWYAFSPKKDEVITPFYVSFKRTRQAISRGEPIIHTLQSYFITADLIKSGYTVYLYYSPSKAPIKVDINTQIGSEKIGTMKSQKSVEKWIMEELLLGKI